jgi:hypothetical protein
MNDSDLRDAFASLLDPLPSLGELPERTAVRGARRRRRKLALLTGTAGVAAFGAVLLALPGEGAQDRLVPVPPEVQPTTAAPVAVAPTLVLQGEGLDVLTGPASLRHLQLAGTDASTITDAVTRALGTGRTSALPDCGASVQVVQWPGFALYLDGTRFVGWSEQAGGEHLTTADGIGVGTTLADLRSARTGVQVRTGSLGAEWSLAEGLAGGLSGTQPTSTITRIAVGQTCLAR